MIEEGHGVHLQHVKPTIVEDTKEERDLGFQ